MPLHLRGDVTGFACVCEKWSDSVGLTGIVGTACALVDVLFSHGFCFLSDIFHGSMSVS